MNCMPKTVTPGPSAPESSTLTSRLPSHPGTVSRRNLRAVSDTKALKKIDCAYSCMSCTAPLDAADSAVRRATQYKFDTESN